MFNSLVMVVLGVRAFRAYRFRILGTEEIGSLFEKTLQEKREIEHEIHSGNEISNPYH